MFKCVTLTRQKLLFLYKNKHVDPCDGENNLFLIISLFISFSLRHQEQIIPFLTSQGQEMYLEIKTCLF